MKLFAAVIVTTLTMSAAYAGGQSYDTPPLAPRPVPHHVEPPPIVQPPLTPFDRNMVPPGYGATKLKPGTVIDLSEPLSFGDPESKNR